MSGYAPTCKICGTVFHSSDVRRLYCESCRSGGLRSKNPARQRSRQAHDLHFVGVDGEGVDRPDGTHDYVMLSVGDKTLFSQGECLSLGQILSFLWECYTTDPGAVYVGFFLGYDFSQWFRQLPEFQAHLLFTSRGIAVRTSLVTNSGSPYPDPVVWDGWEFDLMAGRRFKLRPHVCRRSLFNDGCRNRTCDQRVEDSRPSVPGSHDEKIRSGSGSRNNTTERGDRGWLYVCDTGSFWQTSFLKVIDPAAWGGHGVCSVEEFRLVVEGKESRGHSYDRGDVSYFVEMARYNTLENRLLAEVTSRLNQGFMNDQIPIRIKRNEWFGPGRAAQTWLDMVHRRIADPVAMSANRAVGLSTVASPERKNEYGLVNADIYMSVPSWFVEAARDSYYGGWFEVFMHGDCGDLWEYDINSAYPHVISRLSCLHVDAPHNGSYSRGDGPEYERGDGTYTLLYGIFEGSDPYVGALPFRTRTGNILRPGRVRGWYWAHEVEAARDAGLIDSVHVEQWVSYKACTCSQPFNLEDIGIGRMYDLRLQVGKNTPAGKALKLTFNSVYGKKAQSVGKPKYANPVYASLITSWCRTFILQAIRAHPGGTKSVAMVATDAVYFTESHPGLSMSKTELGAWDETRRRNMTILMPGVYWDQSARDAFDEGGTPKFKSRGVAARDLAANMKLIDEAFACAYADLLHTGRPYVWPTLRMHVRMQITSPKLALHRNDWSQAGRIEHQIPRDLSANPEAKRDPQPYIDQDLGVLRTRPYTEWSQLDTTPYQKSFGYQDPDLDPEMLLDIDGRDTLAELRDLLMG